MWWHVTWCTFYLVCVLSLFLRTALQIPVNDVDIVLCVNSVIQSCFFQRQFCPLWIYIWLSMYLFFPALMNAPYRYQSELLSPTLSGLALLPKFYQAPKNTSTLLLYVKALNGLAPIYYIYWYLLTPYVPGCWMQLCWLVLGPGLWPKGIRPLLLETPVWTTAYRDKTGYITSVFSIPSKNLFF